jgi:hypothetical protein
LFSILWRGESVLGHPKRPFIGAIVIAYRQDPTLQPQDAPAGANMIEDCMQRAVKYLDA